jgi:hypothetical protein
VDAKILNKNRLMNFEPKYIFWNFNAATGILNQRADTEILDLNADLMILNFWN